MQEPYNRTNNDEALGARSSNQEATGNTLREYTVEERDTHQDIARKHGITWEEIMDANRDVLDSEEQVLPGFKLKIPARPNSGRP